MVLLGDGSMSVEINLVVQMTDSAASYLVSRYLRPHTSGALRQACVLAASGDYSTARDSLDAARNRYEQLSRLLPSGTASGGWGGSRRDFSVPVLEDSFRLAERLLEKSRAVLKEPLRQELVEAASRLLAANARQAALEYELKYSTLSGDMQRKSEEFQSYVTQTVYPATMRYGRAVQSYLGVGTAQELYDLAVLYGFRSLLR
jgi:hypothetical protein